MVIENIEFLCSSPSIRECPKQELPEFAFIGRSNVGKSSLINMLAGRKGLAKISSTPGKTRLINHFKISSAILDHKELTTNNSINHKATWFLVDLPGYGFAQLSKAQREKFEGVIKNYLEKRENLALTFVLIDSRLEPQPIDINFLNWLGDHEISFVILFTKTDKLSQTLLATNLNSFKKTLALYWAELPLILVTSSKTRAGRENVLAEIEKVLHY
ncbi:MAG: ribosome biogenesis GTP-binding protein YihA/YsxC [Bacteroidales bacterium]|nr:ribosome biogenesis GTP-binding protein YihA/YsxC [Bacteroidales bacterium]